MVGGYAGKILQIDLANHHVSRIPLSEEYQNRLLGGRALAARALLDYMTGEETALSEGSVVVIATAPLSGTGAPGAARFDLASLSAKDDRPAFSNCGGSLGVRLKRAGYDLLVLKGACSGPTWLEISGEDVRFHDAAQLWGLGTGACREQLKNRLDGRRFAALTIGPAGENLVKFASVQVDGHNAGRAGLGAVLGWKRLKAITVEGCGEIPVHDPRKTTESIRNWNGLLRENASTEIGAEYCTACPMHCVRRGRGEEPILEELGMDVIAAQIAAQGRAVPEIYRSIALREGIGDQLAEGVDAPKEKSGKKRKVNEERVAAAFGIRTGADDFCKNYTDAICALGQCMFTVNGLEQEMKAAPLLSLVKHVTGKQISLEDLLAIGAHCRELERAAKKRFEK